MSKTIQVAALVALAATLALLSTTSTASAAASNTGSAFLRMPAQKNFGTVRAKETIRLRGGRYGWKLFLAHRDHPGDPAVSTRTIRLRRGAYRWTDHVRRVQGKVGYEQCSFIDELATPGGPARLCHQVLALPPFSRQPTKGMYRFGSSLAR